MDRIGIYPGSFDPPTYGHLDIIERARGLVDHLIVAVGANPSKSGFLPVEQRAAALAQATSGMEGVEVDTFEGLLVNYAQSRDCRILIRGLRAVSDYEYEFRIAMANRSLAGDIETVFLIARDKWSFLASSVVREVAELGGDYSSFVPPGVAELIAARQAAAPDRR